MNTKLRTLGLTLVAAIATSAVVASAAQAGEFTAEKYPATITGTQIAKHSFKFNAGTVNCAAAKFHGSLAAAANAITIGAEYSECATPGGAEVVVKMTSCDYVFHAGETLENDRVDGSLDIKCNQAGDEIDIEEPANGCVVKIPPQANRTTLVYTNHKIEKDFDVDIGLTELKYTQNANCAGGAGVFENGEYAGQSTMTGENEEGPLGVTVD